MGRDDVNGLIGSLSGLHTDGKVVPFLGGIVKAHTHGHRQIGADHEAALYLPAEDMQEGAAVVFKQLDVDDLEPCVIGVIHHVGIDLRQGIHLAVCSLYAARIVIGLHAVHDGVQFFRHGGVLLVPPCRNVSGEADAGVVAHIKGGVQRVVIAQESYFVALGADALPEDDLLLKGGGDADLHLVVDLHAKGDTDLHVKAIALQMIQPLVGAHLDIDVLSVKFHLYLVSTLGRGNNAAVRYGGGPHGFHGFLHLPGVRQLVQFVALQHHCRKIEGGLLGVTTCFHVCPDLVFDLRLLRVADFDLPVLCVVDIQRGFDVRFFCGGVGDDIAVAVLGKFSDFSIRICRGIFAVCTADKADEVACVQTVRVHIFHGCG